MSTGDILKELAITIFMVMAKIFYSRKPFLQIGGGIMSEVAINKVKEAEAQARKIVEEARLKKNDIINQAESQANEEYYKIIQEANETKRQMLDKAQKEADEKANPLKLKAIDQANHIKDLNSDKVDGLVKNIVERIVS